MLRRIFGPKRDEVTGVWGKLHNKEICNLYFSPSIIRMVKSRWMRWTGMQNEWRKRGMHIAYWWDSRKERDQCEDQDVDGWAILKWILER
jgi:hypothetical protein